MISYQQIADQAFQSVFNCFGFVSEGVVYFYDEAGNPFPTSEKTTTFDSVFLALVNEFNAKEYQRQRVAEYPPMADYLDGVVKGDQAQIDAYIAACLAVKAKYPKPE